MNVFHLISIGVLAASGLAGRAEALAINAAVAPDAANEAKTAIEPRWRIRGAASDLPNVAARSDLSGLEPATLSFARDDIAGTDTAHLNLVVGMRLGPSSRVWEAYPFVSYQRKETTGTGDIDTFTPGMVIAYRKFEEHLAVRIRGEFSYVIDSEQSSEQVKARVYIEPGVILGDRHALFGQVWHVPLEGGRLDILPELTIIGDLSDVRDPGSNPAFQGGGSYRGIGADFSMRLALGGFRNLDLSGWSLVAGRRQMWFSGDIVPDDPGRTHASLEYSWDAAPVGIALTYSKGRNDDTFQAEDTLSLDLTWRR